MKKTITIILICLTSISYGQIPTMQKTFNRSVAHGDYPTVNAHGELIFFDSLYYFQARAFDIVNAPGFYSSIAAEPYSATLVAGYPDGQSGVWANGVAANMSAIDFIGHAHVVEVTPFHFKISGEYDTAKVKVIMPLPTFETINNIVTLDHDTLKVVYLTTPLTVETFKTLITQK